MVITVGGMIGLGKTTVAELIASELGSKVFYESVDDNPVLPLFYEASLEEMESARYPFLLQLHFLNTRFKSIKGAFLDDNNVIDRSIYEDAYFCKMNKLYGELKGQNRITQLEFDIYSDLLENMLEELESLPKKAPDLMVYLHGDFEKTVLPRIMGRGREFEVDPELIEYYQFLWRGYDEWINKHYSASQVVKIDMDLYDVVSNDADKIKVMELIKQALK